MNILSMGKKEQILKALVEGNSIRSTERMTDIHRDTIMRLLVRMGDVCQNAMDKLINGFHCERIQVKSRVLFNPALFSKVAPIFFIGFVR